MVITHDEAFSLSDFLTIRQKNEQGVEKILYRPTIHFVYMPSDCAIASVHEFCIRQYDPHAQQRRVLTDKDIISGMDEVGVLIMGHDFKTWWVGSRLSIDTCKSLVDGHNATTLQVGKNQCFLICSIPGLCCVSHFSCCCAPLDDKKQV